MKVFAKPIIGILFLTTIVVLILAASMNAHAQDRMSPIPADKMSNDQKKALEEFVAARGTPTGPWVALLRSPDVSLPGDDPYTHLTPPVSDEN